MVGNVAAESDGVTSIVIREFYNNFSPPKYARGPVARLLSTVPAKYTIGLDSIVLTNQSGTPRRQRLGKVTSRGRRQPQGRVLGRYHCARPDSPAWIELYVDKICAEIAIHPWVPMGRTACYAQVLFHEIGHHVDATIRPEFREKEDVADDWGRGLRQTTSQGFIGLYRGRFGRLLVGL
jgi:hypothetical protein